MRALSPRWRAFVEFFLMESPGHGAATAAARRAGFGSQSSPLVCAQLASKLLHDSRILEALAEEAKKIVRAGAPEAAQALINLVRDPTHREHGRAVSMLLARTDPEITRNDINVTHRIVDPDTEAIEELRALRQLGTPREKLLELFGPNGLERVEALELVRRSEQARVIEGEVVHG
jgi:phage terminase small subunit